MNNKLILELESVLPVGMYIPDEIKLLYNWIEDKGYYVDIEPETRHGYLFPIEKFNTSWTDEKREGGTIISFHKYSNDVLKSWFGFIDKDISSRLCIFARSGSDGSMCALWKDDNQDIKIVSMGSGSGSTLTCVLAENALDFLRLIAIGYDEICWGGFEEPPNWDDDFFVEPNHEFQEWVKSTFNTTIPETAAEIVRFPANMEDSFSPDAFFNWVNSKYEK